MIVSQTGLQPGQSWNPNLGESEANTLIGNLNQLEQQMPFLVGLSREDRRKLSRVGPRTRPFVADALATAEANPGLLPRSLDIVNLRARADTLDHLVEVKRAITQLLEKVDDTEALLANEVYGATRSVYAVMKTPASVPGLKEQHDRLAKRFASKRSSRSSEATPTGSQGN